MEGLVKRIMNDETKEQALIEFGRVVYDLCILNGVKPETAHNAASIMVSGMRQLPKAIKKEQKR